MEFYACGTYYVALGQSVVLIITIVLLYILTNKQIKALDKDSRLERQAIEKSTSETCEQLIGITKQLNATNNNMVKTVTELTGLKKTFDDSAEKMGFLCSLLQTKIETSPYLTIVEDAFKGNIKLSANKECNIELQVTNSGKALAQNVIVTLNINKEIKVLSFSGGGKASSISEHSTYTHVELDFGDGPIPSGVFSLANLKINPSKIGAYKINWNVQCAGIKENRGEFNVTVT